MNNNGEKSLLDVIDIPKEMDYVIAYIDLLGTKDLLAKSSEQNIFENIYYPFLLAGKIVPTMRELNWDKFKIKIFSDNILIAYPVKNVDDKNSVCAAYEEMGKLLRLFLPILINHGFLFRGAITVDKLFINDIMVWGKGLSSVVHLEETVAIYPRLIISEDLLNIFDFFGLDSEDFEYEFSCLKDFDDCIFFDFCPYHDSETMDSLLKSARAHIKAKIQTGASPRIMQKYKWFRNYIEIAAEIYSGVKQNAESL